MSKYLDFIEMPTITKTKIFEVRSKSSGYCLAIIKWYSPWRQYCFYSIPNTVFNNTCLLDIVEFIQKVGEMK